VNFTVRDIGGKYQEMKVDAIETNTMDKKEAIELAYNMISAAGELLDGAGIDSDACGKIIHELSNEF